MLDAKARPAATLRTPDWYKSATRWTQLTLAEDDPVRFDPALWIDIFKRTQSNATCLSAGGYIAYYPSKVPLHYVSKYLGDTDPFGTLVEGARRLNMHVMARVDPHAIHQDAADAHPEWIAVDKDGNKRRHWAYPEVWVTCAYGDYNAQFMPHVLEEIARDYDIDAIFANRWQGHGVCYCESCRTRFRAFSGHDLPIVADANDPVWQAWTAWRRTVLTRLVVDWDETVKAVKPHASFIPNMGGASLMEFDLSLIEKHCPFLVVDDQGRRGTEPIWMSGRNGKRMRATFPERPVILITSIGPEEVPRWKDSVTSGPEIQSWIVDGAAQGMLPWFTKFNGVVPDKRWVEPVTDAFALHADLEPVLSAMTPTAEIALLDPATTLRHWAPEHRREAEMDELGFYHALIEAGLPFECLSDQVLTPDQLNRFKVVVLANAACLSDAQCAALTAYVERGGSIVAANETSLRDENGRPRDEFGLADVLGVRLKAPPRGPIKNTYVALSGDHPVASGYDGAERIIGGTQVIAVEADVGAEIPFLYVPDFPDLPMEEVYVRGEATEPAVIARQVTGGGRTVHIPWNIGRTFWEVLAPDHGRLIANAVRWALGGPGRVTIDGLGVFDLSLRENEGGLALAMVNLTNPMMMKGPTRAFHPAGPQRLTIALPEGRRVAAARLLVAGTDVPVREEQGRVLLEVPGIELIEVVHLVWA
ncbi:alpha-amylase family protein [Devosia nitrariae]|uniref:Beta-galactosidase trimerisation domain-containing protein n=1 Tax=Devosia nitrariae TaxID=2071872 RepID=A0ABQ5WAG9_9HYPH|nr:alpha-amylase family protein [Devosia nitrariae]GLQ56868.1 hypothetical protein GCM10010862_41270 [Devosia nitrariae]